MIRNALMFTSILFLFACNQEEEVFFVDTNVTQDQAMARRLTLVSSDVITINNQQFELEAYLWRDFMPVSPVDGQPLISINWLTTVDQSPIPSNIRMIQQYVVYGNLVWQADYCCEPTYPENYKMERVSRNGPKWGPRIKVQVVALIKNTDTNRTYLIRTNEVLIARTD